MTDFVLICICVLLMSMAKGGFPVGIVAIPLLVLGWPNQGEAAREVIGFMIPIICVMDACGMAFYRKKIHWADIRPLFMPTLVGLAAGTYILLNKDLVPDKWLQGLIGFVGVGYAVWELIRWKFKTADKDPQHHGKVWPVFCGSLAGFSSAVTNFAGPVVSMYLLSRRLTKIRFAAAGVAYFFCMNLVKLPIFGAIGLIDKESLQLGAKTLPLVPLGVFLGWWLVKITKEKVYIAFIHGVVVIVSGMLIWKALFTS